MAGKHVFAEQTKTTIIRIKEGNIKWNFCSNYNWLIAFKDIMYYWMLPVFANANKRAFDSAIRVKIYYQQLKHLWCVLILQVSHNMDETEKLPWQPKINGRHYECTIKTQKHNKCYD